MQKAPFKLGDSVKTKLGIQDPEDDSRTLDGWQGRVVEVENPGGEWVIGFALDSITLKSLDSGYIEKHEIDGADWSVMYLLSDELDAAQPRDTKEVTEEVLMDLQALHFWDHLGEQGRRFRDILRNAEDEDAEFDAWMAYLLRKLKFPFEAEIIEHQDHGPLMQVERVKLLSIDEDFFDENYGIIAAVAYDKGFKKKAHIPLADLAALEEKSPNYQPLDDYSVWFANR